MADSNLKQLIEHGLAAMKAGSEVAAKATAEISHDAKDPKLKDALETGNHVSKQWAERIERAREKAGRGAAHDNPIVEAHYEVSRRIREHAPDDTSRDLGIIADGQFALHYWIAAFGTMARYAAQLGMEDVAHDMKRSADEAKEADAKHSALAEAILQRNRPGTPPAS